MKSAWKPSRSVHIKTPRFNLDSMTRLEAAWHTYGWSSDREVTVPLGYPSRDWTLHAWYKQHRKYNNRNKFCLAIRPKNSSQVIGFEAFELSAGGTALLTVAIGNRSWWGKGVVLETRTAILEFLFNETHCRRAWGTPSVRNLPSIFNYKALGFKSEGILRQHGYQPESGAPVDYVIFGLLRDEWLYSSKQCA